jgi:hypothetical protein
LHTKGHATLILADGTRTTVSGTVALHNGDVVEAVDDTITLDLPDGSTAEGRPAFKQSAATRLKVAAPLELLAGDLLVVAPRGTDVEAGGNRVHVERNTGDASAVRLSRGLAMDAGVYRGSAALDSAGQKRSLPALHAIEVSALGRPPTDDSLLPVSDDDPWDRRFLGEAIELGHTLDTYSVGYSNTLGAQHANAALFRSVVPSVAKEPALTPDLLASNPASAGETLVAIAIAGLGRQSDFASRFHSIFVFRQQKANWGVVALDQGVARDPLLTDMQQALNASNFEFAQAGRAQPTATTGTTASAGTTPTTAGVASTGGTGNGSGGNGSGGNGSGTSGGPTTTPPSIPAPTIPAPTLPPPATLPPPPPTGSPVVDGIVNDVNNVLNGLVGGGP